MTSHTLSAVPAVPPVGLRHAILAGGVSVAVLDAIDAILAYGAFARVTPGAVYQYVASGLVGPAAFQMGAPSVLLGILIHVFIAFSAATVYALAATRLAFLSRHVAASGIAYGVGMYAFMNFVVIPLSATPSSPFSWPLVVNGVLGHVVLVGLPIAWFARGLSPTRRANARRLVSCPQSVAY